MLLLRDKSKQASATSRPVMDVGKRDKMANELASEAAGEFLHRYEIGDKQIKSSPETVLQYLIPYLTVRTLQRQEIALDRHEQALNSLKTDSRWIKWSAIATTVLTAILLLLTVALVTLTVVLAKYASRLDAVMPRPGNSPNPPHALIEPSPLTPSLSPPPAP